MIDVILEFIVLRQLVRRLVIDWKIGCDPRIVDRYLRR
jgi:hypothetical protein